MRPNAILILLSTLLIGFLTAIHAHAQQIRGRVVDDATAAGLAGVEVTAISAADTVRVLTNQAGEFILRLPTSGRFFVGASRIGYEPIDSVAVDVAEAEQVTIELRIAAAAILLDPMTITARGTELRHQATWEGYLERYETRRPIGSARVFHEEDRIVRTSRTVGDLLKVALPNRGEGCMNLIMDGQPRRAMTHGQVRRMSTHHFAGIEYYRYPLEAPTEYRRHALSRCAILVLWTKRAAGESPGR